MTAAHVQANKLRLRLAAANKEIAAMRKERRLRESDDELRAQRLAELEEHHAQSSSIDDRIALEEEKACLEEEVESLREIIASNEERTEELVMDQEQELTRANCRLEQLEQDGAVLRKQNIQMQKLLQEVMSKAESKAQLALQYRDSSEGMKREVRAMQASIEVGWAVWGLLWWTFNVRVREGLLGGRTDGWMGLPACLPACLVPPFRITRSMRERRTPSSPC